MCMNFLEPHGNVLPFYTNFCRKSFSRFVMLIEQISARVRIKADSGNGDKMMQMLLAKFHGVEQQFCRSNAAVENLLPVFFAPAVHTNIRPGEVNNRIHTIQCSVLNKFIFYAPEIVI